ncbi:peptidase inhibitor family I36 protein [Streptomyces sp. AS58]|uniref:peptidase inhibitor family I36 protein n=1 Tax=Streptomyces sp. AS58 TaxID=1519489 RepID=UPI000A94CB08|nr:peptidase inhibitor family I36 protein [Streptomyces sp. AS58]
MTAKKKLAMVLAPTVSALGLVVGGVGSASASDADVMAYSCQDNEVCFYQHSNYTGSVFVPSELKYRSAVVDFGIRNFVNGVNTDNAVSSVKNTTGWMFCAYDRPYQKNLMHYLRIDTDDNFVGDKAHLNDRISSVGPC